MTSGKSCGRNGAGSTADEGASERRGGRDGCSGGEPGAASSLVDIPAVVAGGAAAARDLVVTLPHPHCRRCGGALSRAHNTVTACACLGARLNTIATPPFLSAAANLRSCLPRHRTATGVLVNSLNGHWVMLSVTVPAIFALVLYFRNMLEACRSAIPLPFPVQLLPRCLVLTGSEQDSSVFDRRPILHPNNTARRGDV